MQALLSTFKLAHGDPSACAPAAPKVARSPKRVAANASASDPDEHFQPF